MGPETSKTPRPLQNRVTPWGELIADPARGTLMGNRGCLHDGGDRIRRHHRGKLWIFCRLEFKGRWRPVMPPNRYTALFFLDEATAFAAGHRPCGECMHGRYTEFRDAWTAANPELAKPRPSAGSINEALHRERIDLERRKITFRARAGDLPDGTFIAPAGATQGDATPKLILNGAAWPWSPAGYSRSQALEEDAHVEVLTPASTVRAFAAGFRPTARAQES
jgi:methylphosphotriester-DNA--protein-cysteine methyltransferase